MSFSVLRRVEFSDFAIESLSAFKWDLNLPRKAIVLNSPTLLTRPSLRQNTFAKVITTAMIPTSCCFSSCEAIKIKINAVSILFGDNSDFTLLQSFMIIS